MMQDGRKIQWRLKKNGSSSAFQLQSYPTLFFFLLENSSTFKIPFPLKQLDWLFRMQYIHVHCYY